MTKRAGKRKHRMGTQRLPASASPTPRAAPSEQDDLSPSESLALELRALNGGWGLQTPKASELRQALLGKVFRLAMETTDERTLVAAFRALTNAELRQQQIEQMAIGLRIRQQNRELPAQVGVNVNVNTGQPAQPEPPPQRPVHEIIRELHRRSDVRMAISGGKIAEKPRETDPA